ncbi:MAG: transposase [Thermofilaceae archaeon]
MTGEGVSELSGARGFGGFPLLRLFMPAPRIPPSRMKLPRRGMHGRERMGVGMNRWSRNGTPAGPRVLVRAYKVPLPDEARRKVAGLITWYVRALDGALRAVWDAIEWEGSAKNLRRYGHYRVPKLPKSAEFQRRLRGQLLAGCPFATHWVDSVIRTAFAVLKSWRARYLEGRARKRRPRVTRRFARVKKTLVKVDHAARTLRITLRPGEYVTVSWAGAWFAERVQGWEVAEPVLKDDAVVLVFKKTVEDQRYMVVGWDCNEFSIDGFDGRCFYTIDIGPLVRMKEKYERIIGRLQSDKKEELAKKYRKRMRDRERDFLNKLAKQLVETFPNAVFAFEALDKQSLVDRRKMPKAARKRNHRMPWVSIQRKVGERAPVVRVSPARTSRTCPRCGWVSKKDPGRVFKCGRCGLEMNRQRLAAINIWRRAMKKIFGREPDLPPRFWELPEVRLEVRL